MYDRNLIDYLPPFERDIKEFDAILTKAEDPEMLLLWNSIDATLNESFITDASEYGVSRMENIIGIVPKATDTLDARKFALITKMSEQTPFTINTLNQQLEVLCGKGDYELVREVDKKIIHVKVGLTAESNLDNVAELLERVVPANMVIDLTLKYNRHEMFTAQTHEELQSFTHYEIRNEVM